MSYAEETEKMLWVVALLSFLGWGVLLIPTNSSYLQFAYAFTSFNSVLGTWVVMLVVAIAIGLLRFGYLKNKASWLVWILIVLTGFGLNYVAFERIALTQVGFILVWIFLIGIGYGFVAIYNRKDKRIRDKERIVLGVSSLVSIGAGIFIYTSSMPIRYTTQAAVGMAVSVIPCVTLAILYRVRYN